MFALLHHPDINPVILQIAGPLAIRWYSLMYVAAFIFIYLFSLYRVKKNFIKLTENEMSDIIFISFLSGVIGARLGYVFFYDFFNTIRNPLHIFVVWEGGMSFHGGLIGAIIGAWISTVTNKKQKINYFDLSDVFVIPTTLGLAFGRWGNFVNGELWGRPTDAPWGMIFPAVPQGRWFSTSEPWVQAIIQKTGLAVQPGQTMVNLPRHPSQLYEMFLEGIVLFTVLYLLSKLKNKPPRGIIISTFILGYGICRFTMEFFREPDIQIGFLFGGWLTMGIMLSLPMVLLGLAGLIYFNIRKEKNELWG